MSLRDAWESNADAWIRWARRPGFDSYHQFHGRRFLEIVPPPGHLTVDLGAGEGRLARDLQALGHNVVALDASPSLARACAKMSEGIPTVVADAAATPLRSRCADLVIAFMSLMDIDDWTTAIAEASRLLPPGGRFLIAIVHPINAAGSFQGDGENWDDPFVISESYMTATRFQDRIERDGMVMTFHGEHRPLAAYFAVLRSSGFVVHDLREVTVEDPADRWSRIPMFLHLSAVRT
ncbi:MAG TPA: class I SAM-dependent methyltransferase [Acidimicrobiales bacterium]|nr:class I SAM-dependent methyltransferase [Acidimicrobiales bacterium]